MTAMVCVHKTIERSFVSARASVLANLDPEMMKLRNHWLLTREFMAVIVGVTVEMRELPNFVVEY